MTSRMDFAPVRIIVRRSMPMPSRRWEAARIAQGADVVLVDLGHGLGVLVGDLGLEAGALLVGVVQLGEGVADLKAADVELEPLHPVGSSGFCLERGETAKGKS